MRFVIEYYSHTQRALVLPWRIMVDKPDDHPEYGFTLHEIIDRLGEQIPDAEARQTWPRLRQVFNKHAVQSLTTYEQFFIFVDTKIGCLFVKTWTYSNGKSTDTQGAIESWLAEYKIPAQ